MPTLTVLSRTYCHLCDDMIAALKTFQGRFSFEIVVRDVDAEEGLAAEWGDLVPVLLADESELCHYFLDEAKLLAYLSRKG